MTSSNFTFNDSVIRSHNHERQVRLHQLALAISNRLQTGLGETAVEAVLDLLLSGVPPDSVLAVLEQLTQENDTMQVQQQQQRARYQM